MLRARLNWTMSKRNLFTCTTLYTVTPKTWLWSSNGFSRKLLNWKNGKNRSKLYPKRQARKLKRSTQRMIWFCKTKTQASVFKRKVGKRRLKKNESRFKRNWRKQGLQDQSCWDEIAARRSHLKLTKLADQVSIAISTGKSLSESIMIEGQSQDC